MRYEVQVNTLACMDFKNFPFICLARIQKSLKQRFFDTINNIIILTQPWKTTKK